MGCLSSSCSPGDDAMFWVQKDWLLLVKLSSFHVRVSWWAETRSRTTGHNTAQPCQPFAGGFRALSLTHSLKSSIPPWVSVPPPFSLPQLCPSLLSPRLSHIYSRFGQGITRIKPSRTFSVQDIQLLFTGHQQRTTFVPVNPPYLQIGKTSRPDEREATLPPDLIPLCPLPPRDLSTLRT